jgi:hypothetical protein
VRHLATYISDPSSPASQETLIVHASIHKRRQSNRVHQQFAEASTAQSGINPHGDELRLAAIVHYAGRDSR